MTPKEKAKQIYDKMLNQMIEGSTHWTINAKKCSFICVDELIDCLPSVNGSPPNYQYINKYTSEYWREVKNELRLL
jgi:hypothetical protein